MIPDKNSRSVRRKRCTMLLFVMLVCVGFQTGLGLYLGYWQHLAQVKSFPGDAKTYYEVAHWLVGDLRFDQALWSIATRPIGYPLVLALCDRIAPSAIVVVQIIFWCLAQLALFSVLRDRLGSLRLALIFTAASVSCLTFAVLPFLTLTETLALSLVVFSLYFAHRYDSERHTSDLIFLVLSMAIGVTLRPAGMYPLIAVSVAAFMVFQKQKKNVVIGLLCLLPVIVQIGLFHKHFGVARTSIIDSLAIDHYLLSRADSLLRGVPLPVAREGRRQMAYYPALKSRDASLVARYDQYAHDQFWIYLFNVPATVADSYGINLRENMSSGSAFLEILDHHPLLLSTSLYQNIVLSHLGIFLAACSILSVGTRALRRRSASPLRETCFELFAAGLLLYSLLISGLSYWQGDRLSLPAYPPALILAGLWLRRGFSLVTSRGSATVGLEDKRSPAHAMGPR